MARGELCTEEEIKTLVYNFYDRIRADTALGPIFDEHIDDWDKHLHIMVQFWSSMLLGTGSYSGTPMPKHVALPGLKAELFSQWLALFHQTTQELPNKAFAERADEYAQRIARSLWYGYQLNRHPDTPLTEISHG
ncbi:group III truncated hemoglobin [Pollutimonas harenae]|uniref:Group III truncated hemoglobin n=1 Tax=Pollutimonas harenae TaxID=657015 RepID=A0A853H1M9_9BURK|nr:group III truncated hemoglobin [Pollutimonas harenae]NYT86866.1 group III truncated hemoglobin [Pollutimonas harenae]TEA69417.1 group III truncated hemoglobin [Pollutimonas harenae]